MYMIFSFSSQNAQTSSQLSYKVSCYIVRTADRILDVGLEDWQIEDYAVRYHHVIRKIAHMGEYFLLAVTVSFPLYVYGLHGILLMLLAGLICVGFACGDEYHQSFVAGRAPAVKDVCIDAFGVFWGIVLVRIVGWTGRHTIFRPLRRKDEQLRRSQVRQLQNAQDEMRTRQEALRQEQRQAKKERRKLQRELDLARMEEEKQRLQPQDPGRFGRNGRLSFGSARGARYDDRYDDRYKDRYDGRYDDRYDDRSGARYDDRFDDRSGARYDDRYDDRYDGRYDRRSHEDPVNETSDTLSEDMPLSHLFGSHRRQDRPE